MANQFDPDTIKALQDHGFKETDLTICNGTLEPGDLNAKPNTIWVITVICFDEVKNQVRTSHATGWFLSRAEAVKEVLENKGNFLYECSYNFCVIERFTDGVPGFSLEEIWFAWKGPVGHSSKCDWYVPVDRPEWSMTTVNWGLG